MKNVEEDLLKFLSKQQSVTITGGKYLLKHSRPMRITLTLAQNGVPVNSALNESYIDDSILIFDKLKIVGF